ncbi:MAG: sodium:solute symporter family protein [Planctomycetota bacterium]|jgi:Na+/proline symporter
MSTIDWVVFLGFLAYVVWDGVRRARGTKDLESYFAGGRSVAWWAAGLSIMATQASAITVIGTTGQGCEHGMEFVQTYFGLAFAMVLLSIFFVPLYRRQPILTAYQYLERRFGPATRTVASLIFLVSRCLAFAIVIYAPAVVASAMLEIDVSYTIVALGVLTTGYTMIGGVKAVIATDVKQMLVIIGGLILVCFLLLSQLLEQVDFAGLLHVLGASGKLNAVEVEAQASLLPRLNPDFAGWLGADVASGKSFWEDKYNIWSGMIGGLFLHLAYFGTDQSQVQRILTNPSAKESRMALLLSAFAKVPMQALVLFIGVLLYGFLVLNPQQSPMLFRPDQQQRAAEAQGALAEQVEELRAAHRLATVTRAHLAQEIASATGNATSDPDRLQSFRQAAAMVDELRSKARDLVADPSDVTKTERRDVNYIFPHYILNHVPVVLLGLMMAAIFAAAMSSVDSALNSLTAATVVDFYRRLVNPAADETRSLWMSRWITVFWGTCATVAAFYFKEAGSVIEVINKIGSFFYGSLLGVFLLALMCPRAGRVAGLLGLVGGMVAVLGTHWTLQVEFLWYNVIGAAGVLVVGFAVSRFEP